MAETDVTDDDLPEEDTLEADDTAPVEPSAPQGFMSAPALYENTASDMNTEGYGLLNNAVWSVKWERGSFPTLTMEYPLNGKLASLINLDRIILADGGYNWRRQMWRIDNVSPTINADDEPIIEINATHVAGDILANVLSKDVVIANATATQTFNLILDSLAETLPRATFHSDITKVANVEWKLEDGKTAQDIMFGRTVGGTDMESVFDGEWFFDNYDYYFNQYGGRDTSLLIKYGKNMLDYEAENSLDDVSTAVFPFAKYTPGEDGAPGGEEDVQPYTGVATIQWLGAGGLTVWNSPFKGQQPTGKKLANGTFWKVFETASEGTVNDQAWFSLGNNQWVDGSRITFSKSGDYDVDIASNKAIGQGTISTGLEGKRNVINVSGVGTISYAGKGKVAIWNSPFQPNKITGKYVANGTAWKVFQEATDEKGHVWYGLGGSQWIDSSYLTFSKKADWTQTIVSSSTVGYLTIKGHNVTIKVRDGVYKTGKKKGQPKYKKKRVKNGAEVYSKPNGSKTGRVLATGSRWKIFSVADGGGSTNWYNLGDNQWVKSDDVTFDGSKDVEPKVKDQDEEAITTGVAVVYDKPGGKATGKTLKTGTQWKIFGHAETADGDWVNLGGSQWVKEDVISYKAPTDVEPNADQDADEVEQPDVLVTLPEKIIVGTGGEKFERQRIVAFDASDYGVFDEDTLRQVTAAYITDNNVGLPSYSLKVGYAEMTGKLAPLSWVGIYDNVNVYLPQMKADTPGEISEIEWNGNAHRNSSITVGNRQPTITNELKYWSDLAQEEADESTRHAIDGANAEMAAALESTSTQMKKLMTESIKNVTDSFTDRANKFELESQDMHNELTAADDTITAQLKQYQGGFDQYVQSMDGRISDITQTISGIQTNVSNAQGEYSTLTQRTDGLEAKVGDQTVDARLLAFKNEIGSQITDTASGLTNTIDQKVQDGLSSITLSPTGDGTGIQLLANGKTSVAHLNVDQTIANKLNALDTLSLNGGGNVAAFTSWGATFTGDKTPTVQIGSLYGSRGKLDVWGNINVAGNIYLKDPNNMYGGGVFLRYDPHSGRLVYHNGNGDYFVATSNV